MSENEIKIIQQVDEAKLTPDKHIQTKYGLGTIRNLSSGCKTLYKELRWTQCICNQDIRNKYRLLKSIADKSEGKIIILDMICFE